MQKYCYLMDQRELIIIHTQKKNVYNKVKMNFDKITIKSIKLDIFDKFLNNFKLFILKNRIKFDNVFLALIILKLMRKDRKLLKLLY